MNYYICAIIKDEYLYLLEWLDYHLSIGFTEIHLYEDFTSKSHKYITDNYKNVYLHSVAEIPNCKPNRGGRQIATYNNFCLTHFDGWCLFTDIDEYLRLDNGITLDSLTNEFKDEVGIEVRWKCYGANGHIKRPNMLIQEAYSDDFREDFVPNWEFKSFVNLSKTYLCNQLFLNCHYHKKIVNTEHQRGDFRQKFNKLSFNLCHLDHYVTKSWEDYIFRLKRGNLSKGLRTIDYFFELNPSLLPLKDELTKDLNLDEFPTI